MTIQGINNYVKHMDMETLCLDIHRDCADCICLELSLTCCPSISSRTSPMVTDRHVGYYYWGYLCSNSMHPFKVLS